MKRPNIFIFLFILTGINMANAKNITQPINNLFDAMRAHDASMLMAQFSEGALLQRAEADGKVTTTEIEKFADIVASSKKHLDEQLLSIEIKQNGNLASVWTPFAFYLDKKLSHCGVNSFQLVKTKDGWKINYLIDNGYTGDCKEFINKYRK